MDLIGWAKALPWLFMGSNIKLVVVMRRSVLGQALPCRGVPASSHLPFVHIETVWANCL